VGLQSDTFPSGFQINICCAFLPHLQSPLDYKWLRSERFLRGTTYTQHSIVQMDQIFSGYFQFPFLACISLMNKANNRHSFSKETMFEVWEMYWDSAGQLSAPIPCLQFQDFIPSILLMCHQAYNANIVSVDWQVCVKSIQSYHLLRRLLNSISRKKNGRWLLTSRAALHIATCCQWFIARNEVKL